MVGYSAEGRGATAGPEGLQRAGNGLVARGRGVRRGGGDPAMPVSARSRGAGGSSADVAVALPRCMLIA